MKQSLQVGDVIEWTINTLPGSDTEVDSATIIRVDPQTLDLQRTSTGNRMYCNIASTADVVSSACFLETLEERVERFTGRNGFDMVCDLRGATT